MPAPKVLIELNRSRIQGIGVFAVPSIKENQKIADGIHKEDYKKLVPWTEFQKFDADVRKKILAFCIGTPEGFIPPEDLDFNRLSIEWYLNHSCDGNCGFNDDGDFIAIRDIRQGEELTYDYGLAESNPRFAMRCACRSSDCRKTITGNDWKNEDFKAKHTRYMLPRLR